MEILSENYFKTSNNIFSYGLKPVRLPDQGCKDVSL